MRLPGRKSTAILALIVFAVVLFCLEAFRIYADRQTQASEFETNAIQQLDCGVVLTGGPGRVREAIEILGQKKIKKLVISGVFKEAQLLEIFPLLPFYPEIDPEDIILEKRSESTYGNAIQSLALVETLKCQKVLLITSQRHMRRAYMTFRAIYPASIQLQKFYTYHQKRNLVDLDLAIETLKSVFYLIFGKIL